MKTGFGILIYLVTVLSAKAQDYKQDFEKMNRVYGAENNISVNMSYKLLLNQEDKVYADSLVGKMLMYHNEYITSIGSINQVKNNKLMVSIDNERKIIIVSQTPSLSAPPTPISILDSLIRQKQLGIKYIVLNGSRGKYEIEESGSNIYKYDLYFDRETYLISEVDIYFRHMPGDNMKSNSHPKLCVRYSNYNFNAPNTTAFSGANYIKLQGNKFIPTVLYRSYQVINNYNP